MTETILVTGASGFIGYHLVRRLTDETAATVVGIDNFDDYYDPELKRDRTARLTGRAQFDFERLDITDWERVEALFERRTFDRVVHLAAQPGVRASRDQPRGAIHSNVDGFLSILEACRRHPVDHLVFASSSSVYGDSDAEPTPESASIRKPKSLYAATKVSNEAMAHTYAHLHDVPTTGLRFFTVYGPWGRPDMAYYLFADAITRGETIDVYNDGEMVRDFTYVGDVSEGVRRLLTEPPSDQGAECGTIAEAPSVPYRILNVGRGEPVELMRFIELLEQKLGCEADKNFCPKPDGDVERTHADASRLEEVVGFSPSVDLEEGLGEFAEWYRAYHDRRTPGGRASAAE